ncbi:MAG: hypothetical protein QOI04_200 [Verrucomicrobiota bacterium]|jgi:hypothetical protein
MKTTTLSAFLIGCSLSLTLGHSVFGNEKDADTDDTENAVSIEKVTLVRDAGDKFEPVKTFKPSDTFGVLVQLSEPKMGTQVKAIWTIVNAGGMEDKKLLEKEVKLTPESLKDVKNPNRIDFTLTHDDPYPVGEYKAEIYLNGELAETVEFKIQ